MHGNFCLVFKASSKWRVELRAKIGHYRNRCFGYNVQSVHNNIFMCINSKHFIQLRIFCHNHSDCTIASWCLWSVTISTSKGNVWQDVFGNTDVPSSKKSKIDRCRGWFLLPLPTRVVRRPRSSPRGNQIKIATFSEIVIQSSRSRSLGKNYDMVWKVLSQGIHMWNMKALSLTVDTLWPRARLKFLKSRSNFKVKVTRSKIMEWHERSCQKECTYT